MENLWQAAVGVASVAYSLWQFWKFWQGRKAEAEMKGQNIVASAIGAAVNAVYQELVRKWKEGDVKLSEDQRTEALDLAAQYAKEIASSHGVDIGEKYTPKELLDYIERVVAMRKSK